MTRERGAYAVNAYHRIRPIWCAECERAHDGTEHDARATLGARGVTLTGHAYAWCRRCDAYHVTSPQRRAARVAQLIHERPNGVTRERGRGVVRITPRGRTSRRTLRTSSVWAMRATRGVAASQTRTTRAGMLLASGAGM